MEMIAQIKPQIWTRHEKRIKFAFSRIFDKFWMRNLAKRASDLDSARENDGNGLFTYFFLSPDALARINGIRVLFWRPGSAGGGGAAAGSGLGSGMGRPVHGRGVH